MTSYLSILDKNILIVDDNSTNIILIQAILESEGFKNTYSATSAIEAYETLEHQEINLILMDVIMPEINGLEATEAIKANTKFSSIPIVMVTATDDDEILKKSFELGAVDFVRKPINQVELIARINTILQSQEKDDFIIQHSRFDIMEEIVGMLAHQWRQPLSVIAAIIGALQVQKTLAPISDKDLDTALENISKYTSELSHMITTFREFFKTDALPTLSDPNSAITEAYELMKEDLQQRHINVEMVLGEMQDTFYTQNLLVQVLTNLIANSKEAFEYRKIKNPKIIISTLLHKNKIRVLFEDNAGGIDEDIIPYVFEPYYSTKKEKNGKGLGLYIAKNILNKQLGGNISVTSIGDKSKFLISFPLTKKDDSSSN